jgi:hypothetical protein
MVMKKALLISLVVLAMAAGVQAADTVVSMSVADWAASPNLAVGDKVIAFQSCSLPGTTGIVFTVYDILPGQISIEIKPQATVSNDYLDYAISIDQTKSPLCVFEQVYLTSDNGSAQGATVTMNIVDAGVVIAPSAGPAVTSAISGDLHYLTIHETFVGASYLDSATSTFTATPEPMTLGLFGIGVLFLRRRIA